MSPRTKLTSALQAPKTAASNPLFLWSEPVETACYLHLPLDDLCDLG